jgi:hypothetical protein
MFHSRSARRILFLDDVMDESFVSVARRRVSSAIGAAGDGTRVRFHVVVDEHVLDHRTAVVALMRTAGDGTRQPFPCRVNAGSVHGESMLGFRGVRAPGGGTHERALDVNGRSVMVQPVEWSFECAPRLRTREVVHVRQSNVRGELKFARARKCASGDATRKDARLPHPFHGPDAAVRLGLMLAHAFE